MATLKLKGTSMPEFLDPVLLARIQFAFTISFHIIFPAMSIGLASYLTVLEWRWLATKNNHYRDVYLFWVKIFAVAFGMGVVSGVVMSYQLGTNWSIFSDKIGNVIGPLLGFEVLTAFFLEASFLGIMLFGWGRVSHRMHFASTAIVAVGTLISAFWILSANSWMQTPQGFTVGADGRLNPVNWLDIIFNPSFPYRLLHMVTAAYLVVAFVVGGVGALYLQQKRFLPQAKIMLGMAVIMASLVAPAQLVIGDLHGTNTLQYQPAKIAAIEAIWHTSSNVPLVLFAFPDQETQANLFEISIPNLASIVLTHTASGTLRGISSFGNDAPPVAPVFYSFRVMVGIGMLMICIGIVSTIQYLRGKLFTTKWLHYWWIAMMPSGFVALLAGWFVTEIGRQPYVVYGVIRTMEAATPSNITAQVAWSLASFIVIYSFIFGAASYYILKLIAKGIVPAKHIEKYYQHSKNTSVVDAVTRKGDPHV
jgi:cytochrome d ubiquinol oxidase subunit I